MWTLHALASPTSGIAVWRLDLDLASPWHDGLLDGLATDEQVRARHYQRDTDRLRFTATRLALRRLLAEHTGSTPEAIRLIRNGQGKPAVAGGGPEFNVSHTGQHALLAISAGPPVGIDIETIQPRRNTAALAGKVFSPAEQAWLNAQPDAVAAFYTLWSCKEAVLKAWGCGIAGHMARLCAVPGRDGRMTLRFDDTPLPDTHAWLLPAPDGHSAALAIGPTHSPF